jgi:hypothetical protein
MLAPAAARADRSYALPRAAISVTLERSGEVRVQENLTYRFSGLYTGAFRDIPLRPGVRVSDVGVSEGGRPYSPGGKTAIDSRDAAGRFGFARLAQGLRIVWHYRQNGGERTFTLRYRLRGVVIAHEDAVEVAPQVWGNQWQVELGSLAASVQAEAATSATHAWVEPAWLGHRLGRRGARVTAALSHVPNGRSVTLRVLYPPGALAPGAPYAQHVHDDALPSLVRREDANQARAVREHRELEDALHHPVWWILAAIALAIIPAGLLAGGAHWLVGRERGTGAAQPYFKEPPDDMAPALVPSLLDQRAVYGGPQLAATLFELARRGRYRMTPVTLEHTSIAGLRRREIDDVELSYGDDSIALDAFEAPVAEIFDAVIEEGPMSLSRVAKTFKDMPREDRPWFQERAAEFEAAVREAAAELRFWGSAGMRVRWTCVAVLATAATGVLIAGIVGLSDEPLVRNDLIISATGVALLLSTVVVALLPARIWRRRPPELQAAAERWGAFRRYLRDFPRLADKPADSLVVWERLLVFGIAFGLADRVLEAARIHFPGFDNASGLAAGGSGAGGAGDGGYSPSQFSADMHGAFGSGDGGGGGGGGGGGDFGGGGGGAW